MNLKTLSLDPDDAVANSQLACSYYYQRKYKDAKAYFKRVFELDPAFGNSPQLFLAHIALGEKSYVDAIQYFRSFLEYHPNSPSAVRVKGTLKTLTEGTMYVAGAPIRKR